MFGRPIEKELSEGVRFFWLPSDKFKTVTVKMFLHQDLTKDLASKTALLPAVLQRGTKQYPDSISLRRSLENLYGADLSTEVGKKGERHLIEIGLEMIHPDFVEDKNLFQKGLEIMRSLINEPLIEDGAFRRAYVEQEKDQLAQEIKSLINDKTSYALERCIREMCVNERYGVYKYGSLESLEPITSEELYIYSKGILRENPIDIYLVGLQNEDEVESLFGEVFSFSRSPKIKKIAETEVFREAKKEVSKIDEEMPVSQGKLILGYRTNVAYDNELYYPLAFYNGILGGFPHSKLFQNVREKASLAYFVFSRMDRHKGVMVVAAGIDGKDYDKALEIIQAQTEAIARGEISDEEMENTRIAFMNQLRSQEDSAGSLISFYLDSNVGGRKHDLEEVMEELKKVKKEDVVSAAQKIALDTVYFLHGGERG